MTSGESEGPGLTDWRPLVERLEDGELALRPLRSGGPWDPLGCRADDVKRADDLVAVVDGHPGRWVMLTLTVDRTMWTCPEAAYQRCNERVREVCRAVSRRGVHISAFEVQTKTGDGWPHWHVLIWAPDDRTRAELKRQAVESWTIRTPHYDPETGEVESWSRERIGFVDVQVAECREGVARYLAKYVVKPWQAIPRWMGESRRQLRKVRLSAACFEWLESVGRHKRRRGSRRKPTGTRRKARRLFERMARSGRAHAVFQRVGERLKFVRVVPVPADERGCQVLQAVGAEPLQLGKPSALRWRVTWSQVVRLCRDEVAALSECYVASRLAMLPLAWSELQRE